LALAAMARAGSGHIVNVSSLSGRVASEGTAVYNLTKFGVTGFSEALRQEARHVGVRVTVIEPGFTETELLTNPADQRTTVAIKAVREQLGRLLDPDDVAEAIVWVVTRPEHVTVAEIVMNAKGQG